MVMDGKKIIKEWEERTKKALKAKGYQLNTKLILRGTSIQETPRVPSDLLLNKAYLDLKAAKRAIFSSFAEIP